MCTDNGPAPLCAEELPALHYAVPPSSLPLISPVTHNVHGKGGEQ